MTGQAPGDSELMGAAVIMVITEHFVLTLQDTAPSYPALPASSAAGGN